MLLGIGAGEGPWASGYVTEPQTTPGPWAEGYNTPAPAVPAALARPAATPSQVAAAIKKAAGAPVAAATSALASFPWLKAGLIGAGVLGAVVLLSAKSGRQARKNPDCDDEGSSDDEEDNGDGSVDQNPRRAMDFFREFTWGNEPGRVRRARVSSLPRELVQLGTLEAITYSARKGGEKLADYIHHFGEEGHRKPKLTVDPRNQKLHIIGGDYGVEAAGIVR